MIWRSVVSFVLGSFIVLPVHGEINNGKEFRDIFVSLVGEEHPGEIAIQNKISGNGLKVLDQLAYVLPPELSKLDVQALVDKGIAENKNPRQILNDIALEFSKYSPASLLEASQETAVPEAAELLKIRTKVNNELSKRNILVVIVPGFLGEWVAVNPFSEIVNNEDSAFHEEFRRKLYPGIHEDSDGTELNDTPSVTDFNFSMEKVHMFRIPKLTDALDSLKATGWRQGLNHETMLSKGRGTSFVVTKGLDEYFDVGSIDHDGRAQLKAAIFQMEAFSLESVQNIEDTAKIYNRRLAKFLNLMQDQDEKYEIILLGYSRGTPIALEMLAQAQDHKENYDAGLLVSDAKNYDTSWLAQVKAMVSMGGVVYGSTIADLSEIEGTPEFERRQKVRQWVEEAYAGNKDTNLSFIQLLRDTSGEQGGLGSFGTTLANLPMALEQISRIGISARRTAIVAEKFSQGLEGLSTRLRLEWWQDKSNKLPTHITYYGLPAVMASPDIGSDIDRKLGENTSVYAISDGEASADLGILRGGYANFIETAKRDDIGEGQQLMNDSQVTPYKVNFWPQLHKVLSPHNTELKSELLGIAGTHHWGLAYKRFLRTDIVTALNNPFPRVSFLKAIAGTVAIKQPKD